jgi:BirA family biotin operon repressor/biotin-[acetyl-CoA-carboxylase] ligase
MQIEFLSELEAHLSKVVPPLRVLYFDSLPSTNRYALECATAGDEEGLLVLAERQSEGRGRFSRVFFSPAETGIYMTLLLRRADASHLPLIPVLAGTAAAEAVEALAGKAVGIKWVNDLLIDGKKICGILAEGGFSANGEAHVALGIGINAYLPKEIPTELADTLGAVWEKKSHTDMRPRLIAELLNRFYAYYLALPDTSFLDGYRRRSVLIGRSVRVHNAAFDTAKAGGGESALVLGIEQDASLLVRYRDGRTERLLSGEVTLSL